MPKALPSLPSLLFAHAELHLTIVRDIDDLFSALTRSSFRQGFRLGAKEKAYLEDKGMPTVLSHARDFIEQRLAPAEPKNDGKQTPWKGHPVFVAQHATATCCRGCLAKWHHIEKGRELTPDEQAHTVEVIERWLHGARQWEPMAKPKGAK